MASLAPRATGAGGLSFRVSGAPGGVGRIQILPFQVDVGQPAIGNNTAGTRFAGFFTPAADAGLFQMITAQVSWAVFRLIGIVTVTTRHLAVTDQIELVTLQTANGGNLLLSNTGNRVELFDIANPTIQGLRDYPLVRSPNTLTLTLRGRDLLAGGAASTFRGNTVVELGALADNLADDAYGAHLPSPASRTNALIRKPVGRI